MSTFADEARSAIDPVVVPAGFVASSYDDGVTWCAAYDDLAASHPTLAPEQPAGVGACVDLTMHGRDGRVTGAELEGIPLGDALRRAGLARSASDVDDVLGLRVDVAAPVLASAVAELLAVT